MLFKNQLNNYLYIKLRKQNFYGELDVERLEH